MRWIGVIALKQRNTVQESLLSYLEDVLGRLGLNEDGLDVGVLWSSIIRSKVEKNNKKDSKAYYCVNCKQLLVFNEGTKNQKRACNNLIDTKQCCEKYFTRALGEAEWCWNFRTTHYFLIENWNLFSNEPNNDFSLTLNVYFSISRYNFPCHKQFANKSRLVQKDATINYSL